MRMLCLLAGHKPVPSEIWNHGYYFSRCQCCDRELIGRGGIWRTVPRGYRIVWRPCTERMNWTPWAPPAPDCARLSDLLQGTVDPDAGRAHGLRVVGPGETLRRSTSGSVVEGFHIRAAAG